MNENADMDYHSDDEVNRKTHSRLLDEVLQLDKRQYVKKPSRTEPSTHVSEFTLVKPSAAAGRRNTIHISDLTKSLKQKSKHVIISNKIKSATAKAKTLRKPLEKPQAEKIRRSIGFQKTKSELNKWNSVVDKNRVAAQLMFPLNQGDVDLKEVKGSKDIEFPKRYKSELDIELEKLEPQSEPVVEEDQFPLSMEELVQKRKEMARLRAHQSYQEAKAYKRNKIKSKTFHRIQRKERIKQQIKEFEELKKTDPEEALRKLEQLEKTRAEERMSLRHRSTGQWAKNKQIRAKYDKESRQAITQQLTISRELTEKRALHMDSDSDSDDPANIPENIPQLKLDQTDDVNEFVSGYRKFWNEQNKTTLQTNENTANTFAADEFSDSETEYVPYEDKKSNVTEESSKLTTNQMKDKHSNKHKTTDKQQIQCKKQKIKERKERFCNSQWTVTPMKDEMMKPSDNLEVENIFDHLEYETLSKVNTKIDKLKSVPVAKKQKISVTKGKMDEKQFDSEFAREKIRPEVDEELINTNVDSLKSKNGLESGDSGFFSLASNNTDEASADTNKNTINNIVNIDPNNFLTVKQVKLDTKLPTVATGDDNSDSDNDQRAYIAEAFEDDDLMEDFSKEKQDVIDRDKPQDVDLTLPGWGSWGGKGVKVSKRKRKRFIVKAPSELPRRDDNKGSLIINEHKDTKIRKHQVSEVPFPFKSVKDYEASIRAPIGDTFVPQTAFRRLIKPSLVTKKGAVIEPMSKEVLLNQKFTQNGLLVKR